MKIVCGSCGAKYSIADEKVQGKVFKIRCKKCSNVIVVKGDSQQEEGHSQEAFGDSGMAGAYGGTSAAAEWYVVVDGEQVGPISPEEIEAYYASGRVNDQSFAWRDGLGDWVALSELDEFAHLAHLGGGGADATSLMDAPFANGAGADDGGAGADDGGAGYNDGYDDDATSLMPASDFRAQIEANEAQAAAAAGSDAGYADQGGFAESNADSYGSAEPASGGYEGYGDSSADAGYDAGGYDAGGYDDSGYDDGGGYDSYGDEGSDNQGMFSSFDSGADGADSGYDSFGGFGGADAQEADSSSSGVAAANDMIGQRNENSVLFSLSSLDQVSAVSGGGEAQSSGGGGGAGGDAGSVTEGSGLIDIQALASAHKVMKGSGQTGGPDISGPGADEPFGAGTMGMPALMPMGSHKSNKPLIIGLVVLGVVLVSVLGGVIYYLATKEEPKPVIQQIVQAAPAPANQQAAAADPNAAKVQAEAAAAAKAVENGAPAPETEDGEAVANSDDSKKEEEKSESDDSRDREESSRRADRRDPEPKKEEPRRATSNDREEKKSEDIFDLLDKGGDKKSAGASKSSGGGSAPANVPEKLSRSMVQNTVAKYNGRIHNCYTDSNRKKMSGAVFVKYTIKPSGRISSARVSTGKFKGTDVGKCVERVVRSMKFPQTQSSLTVNYPFILK